MSGPNYPLAKAFEMAGWRTLAVDLLFGEENDFSKLPNQVTIRKQLRHADFIWAALDCSDKSRIREIPVKHSHNRAMPLPLRSEEFPTGMPELQGYDKERVAASNDAAEFIRRRIEAAPNQRRRLRKRESGKQHKLAHTC